MLIASYTGEFRRYRSLAERATAALSPNEWHRRLQPDGNSIATLVQHLAGNLASRFADLLHTDGETSARYRDREFDDCREPLDELQARWKQSWDHTLHSLEGLRDSDLARTITIRRVELTVAEALARSIAHVAYHTGQIVLLAQTFQTTPWQSLSVPRGRSMQYLAAPQLEKPPGP